MQAADINPTCPKCHRKIDGAEHRCEIERLRGMKVIGDMTRTPRVPLSPEDVEVMRGENSLSVDRNRRLWAERLAMLAKGRRTCQSCGKEFTADDILAGTSLPKGKGGDAPGVTNAVAVIKAIKAGTFKCAVCRAK